MHIFRWDLDKTYLETSFGSVRGLIRTAFETADEKKNVPGSAALLRALVKADPDCQVTVLSGSPTQMREVLEEKFALDGISIHNLVLKDNLRNIRKGRIKAVTNQIGYKLPVLFQQRAGYGPGNTETLFGDDTESDALIYTLYAEFLAGKVTIKQIGQVMEIMGTRREAINTTFDAIEKLHEGDVVEDIFIRIHRGIPMRAYTSLSPKVIPVFSWFQAGIILLLRGRITPEGLARTAASCCHSDSLTNENLSGLAQDLVRRGHISGQRFVEKIQDNTLLKPLIPSLEEAFCDLGTGDYSTPQTQLNPLNFADQLKSFR